MNEEVSTADIKHIFIDIVSYTYKRSVEAQTELIDILNKIVRETVLEFNLSSEQIIYIPTGDGLCISLVNILNPYDVHLSIGLGLLKRLDNHNKSTESKMRQFQIRIAINENVDNLITDINSNRNISGSGINYASRILSLCDGNQILIRNSVYEKLVQREKYMNSFSSFTGKVKHNVSLRVHQYTDKELGYLNNGLPNVFKPKEATIKKIPKIIAYYLSLINVNKDFIVEKIKGGGQRGYSLVVLFYQLAEDYYEESKVTEKNPDPTKKVNRELAEQFEYLQSIDFWIICDLRHNIIERNFNELKQYFSDDQYLFTNDEGKSKLNLIIYD